VRRCLIWCISRRWRVWLPPEFTRATRIGTGTGTGD
jgi:hypothetical protein